MAVASRKPIRRKPDDERREATIKVLATNDERDAFQAAADAAGMSLSTWLRWVAKAAIRPEAGK
jgi:hypothetical protein